MAKKSGADKWAQAKLYFEMGKGVREISRLLDLPSTTVSRKSQEWKKNSLEQPIQAIASAAVDLGQRVPPELMPTVQREIENKLAKTEEKLDIKSSILNIDTGGLNFIGLILKNTIAKAQSGELSWGEASKIVATIGLSVDKIANRAGIGRESPENQINIQQNNNATSEALVVQINPVRGSIPEEDE